MLKETEKLMRECLATAVSRSLSLPAMLCRIDLRDEGAGSLVIDLRGPANEWKVREVLASEESHADVILQVQEVDLRAILSGKQLPQVLVLDERMQVEGEQACARAISSLFYANFQRIREEETMQLR